MDRKTLIAVVVVGLIILLTPYYYNWVNPKDEPPVPTERTLQSEQLSAPVYDNSVDSSPSMDQEQQDPDAPWYVPDPIGDSEEVVVRTPLFTATFSTRGAAVRSWIVLPSQPYLHEQEELVRSRWSDQNLVLVARGGHGLLRTADKNFEVNTKSLSLSEGDRSRSLVFTLPLEGDSWYRETYTFHADLYSVDILIESSGLGSLTGAATATFGWGGGMAYTEADTAQDHFYTDASFMMGRSKQRLKSKGTKLDEEIATGPTQWVAQRTKYFLIALIPEQPANGARLSTWPEDNYAGKYAPKIYESSLIFDVVGDDFRKKLTFYAGPLEQHKVRETEPTLDEMMSWGWVIIEPFSKMVHWSLVNLHKVIPNYGVVLILFSILVKVIVWPLTAKSYKSMKRMQLIQPLVKGVQAKYKENPQKMQQEVMALYKEHKVNPMGGCLPTLLQMPLLYGLFIVFRSTIELRGQPFVFWISDLSMPDVLFSLPFSVPLYGDHVALLPIIMAVSTYLQSRQTATDPNQKMMTMMMPFMFLFLFNNFPSGLTLYYTLFNLLSYAQQKLLKVSDPALGKKLEEASLERERVERRKQRKNRG